MYARPAHRRDEDRGASAVEYGLMVAAIAAVIVGVVFGLGSLVRQAFDKTCSALTSEVQPGCVAKGDQGTVGTGADPVTVPADPVTVPADPGGDLPGTDPLPAN